MSIVQVVVGVECNADQFAQSIKSSGAHVTIINLTAAALCTGLEIMQFMLQTELMSIRYVASKYYSAPSQRLVGIIDGRIDEIG